jgi:hypothetical protein
LAVGRTSSAIVPQRFGGVRGMTRRSLAQRKDYRFTVARSEPIDPTQIELARALLNVAPESDAFKVLVEIRKLSINRRKSKGDTGPYLDVVKKDGRAAIIYVFEGYKAVESTRVSKDPDRKIEEHLDAVNYLAGYIRRANLKTATSSVETARDIPVATALDEFVEAHKAERKTKGPSPGMTQKEIDLSEGDPSKWHAQIENCINQIKDDEIGRIRLGQIGPNTGKDYKRRRQKKPKLVGGKDADGNVVGPNDRGVALHLYIYRRAINWFLHIHKIPLNFDFEEPDYEFDEPVALEWEEYIRLKLVCRGLQWGDRGFKTKSIERNGVTKTVWDKNMVADRDTMRSIEHLIEIYFASGSRLRTIPPMTWSPCDWHGYIDTDSGWIYRNGKKSKHHKEKPRKPSELLPYFTRRVRQWKLCDDRRRPGWDRLKVAPEGANGPSNWIIHDRFGNPVKGVDRLLKRVFKQAGLKYRNHDLKHTGVTIMFKRGFTITQIANRYKTTERVLRETYVNIDWEAERVSQASVDVITCLRDLGGKIPRYEIPDPVRFLGEEAEAA